MSDTHWRNSMKPVRFFFLDVRAGIPFLVAMIHLRWWTLALAGITTLIFYILETRGLSFIAALRAFRVWLVTKKRPNILYSNRTRMVDFSFEKGDEKVGAPEKAAQTSAPSPKNAPAKKSSPSSPASSKAAANQMAKKTASKTVRPVSAGKKN